MRQRLRSNKIFELTGAKYLYEVSITFFIVILGVKAADTAEAITQAASRQNPVGPLCIRDAISCVSKIACRGLPAFMMPIGGSRHGG